METKTPWKRTILRPESADHYNLGTQWAVRKMAEPIQDTIWVVDLDGRKEACVTWGCTLPLPGEYNWTVRVRRRCGILSNDFEHLLYLVTQMTQISIVTFLQVQNWRKNIASCILNAKTFPNRTLIGTSSQTYNSQNCTSNSNQIL